jgi:hypothetical protein
MSDVTHVAPAVWEAQDFWVYLGASPVKGVDVYEVWTKIPARRVGGFASLDGAISYIAKATP